MLKKHLSVVVNVAALAAAMPAGVLCVRADASTDMAALRTEVSAALEKITNGVSKTAEEAMAQAKKAGEVSAETKAKADELLATQSQLAKSIEAMTEKLDGNEAKINESLQAMAEQGRRGGDRAAQSIGAQVAGHDVMDKIRERGVAAGGLIKIQAAITAAGTGAGLVDKAPVDSDVGNLGRHAFNLISLFARSSTQTSPVPFVKQTVRTNNAAMTGEGVAAAESAYTWVDAEAPVRKIAHKVPMSEEVLADSSLLEGEINNELIYGVDEKREYQIASGDGTGENLSGILNEATAFSAASGLPNATRIDRLRLAILQLSLAGVMARDIVLHDEDWAAIELLKDTQGRFIFGNPAQGTTPMLWGKGVTTTMGFSAGEWSVGDYQRAATYYDRKEIEVLFSSEDGNNFSEGMVTAKATVRGALAWKRAYATVKGDFTFS